MPCRPLVRLVISRGWRLAASLAVALLGTGLARAQEAPAASAPAATAPATAPAGDLVTDAATRPALSTAPATQPVIGQAPTGLYMLSGPGAVLTLNPRGASVVSAQLTGYRDSIVDPTRKPEENHYPLLTAIGGPDGLQSLSAETLVVDGFNPINLLNTRFTTVSTPETLPDGSTTLAFSERIVGPNGPMVKLVRRYTILSPKALGVDAAGEARLAGGVVVRVTQEFINLDTVPHTVTLSFIGPVGLRSEDPRGDILSTYAGVRAADGTISHATAARATAVTLHWPFNPGSAVSLGDDAAADKKLAWVANTNKYFAAVLAPRTADSVFRTDAIKFGHDTAFDRIGDVGVRVALKPVVLAPGTTVTQDWDLFLTPRSESALTVLPAFEQAGYKQLKDIDMNFCGMACFTPILIPLTAVLKAIMYAGHWLAKDFGVAIILLVIVVRIVLHPLTKYGQVQMMKFAHAMKVIGPRMKAIQEKYKDDRAALAQAQQALFSEANVSPAAPMLGCMPMLLQMPIWFALYYAISHSIDLRHEPFWPVYFFTKWLTPNFLADLSAPDRLVYWGGDFQLPLIGWLFQLGPIQSLNILPFGMGFFMYLNQKLMPQASASGGNPEQEAVNRFMLKFMPIFFALIMYNMPSGLNLYIMTSMAMGVVEQKRIRRHFYELHPEADPKNAPTEAAGSDAVGGTLIARDDLAESWRAKVAAKKRKK